MGSGWFAFAVTASIILCAGLILAIALLRSAWAQREREALTGSDLRALEESAVMLIEQLKADVDEGLETIEARSSELMELLRKADEKLTALQDALANAPEANHSIVETGDPSISPQKQRVLSLASSGKDPAQIARDSGLGCAEVKLMLRLSKMHSN